MACIFVEPCSSRAEMKSMLEQHGSGWNKTADSKAAKFNESYLVSWWRKVVRRFLFNTLSLDSKEHGGNGTLSIHIGATSNRSGDKA